MLTKLGSNSLLAGILSGGPKRPAGDAKSQEGSDRRFGQPLRPRPFAYAEALGWEFNTSSLLVSSPFSLFPFPLLLAFTKGNMSKSKSRGGGKISPDNRDP